MGAENREIKRPHPSATGKKKEGGAKPHRAGLRLFHSFLLLIFVDENYGSIRHRPSQTGIIFL
jgi:hypothetical protein